MKKVISASALAALAMSYASADGLAYRIFIGTFSDVRGEKRVDDFSKKVQDKVGDLANLLEVDRYISDKNEKVVFIDTKPISRGEAFDLLRQVKQLTGLKDSWVKLKTEQDYKIVTEKMKERGETEPNLEDILQGSSAVIKENLDDANPVSDDAQQSSPVISLDNAVKSILATNPNIKEAELNYLQIGKDLNIAQNAYYPTLDLSGYTGYQKKRLDDGVSTRKGDGRVSGANVTLSQNLYNGGADKNRINSQSARLDSAAYSIAQKADRLTLQAVNAYLEVIKTKQILDIELESVRSHEKIYNQIRDRAKSGFGVASEERQAGSRYTLAQSNLIAAQNNYEDAIATFEKLYGSTISSDSLSMPEFNITLPTSEKAVYDKAMLCNPSLLVQRSNIAMAESVVKEKAAAFRPKLDLEVAGKYEHSDVLYNNYEDATVDAMLKLRYNIFNKGADKLEKQKSKIAASSEQQTLEVLTRDLKESLRFSWQNYTLEQKKLAYLKEHVDYSKATLDSYQDEFKIGRRDLINLLDAENEYNSALKEVISTQTSLLYSKYRLLDNMGLISDSFEPGFAKKYIQGACSIQNDLN